MRRLLVVAVTTLIAAGCKPVQPPRASLVGPESPGPVGIAVALDGSGSADPQGRALTYRWHLSSLPPGSRARIDNADLAIASFRADVEGDYVATLVVSNGVLTDTAQLPWTARCGVAAPALALEASSTAPAVGDQVGLQAVITDPDTAPPCSLPQTASIAWSFAAAPAGSRAALNAPGSLSPSFAPDLPGLYRVRAVATDSTGRKGEAVVEVTASECGANAPVIAEITATPAFVGRAVWLAAQVGDADLQPPCNQTDPLAWSWRFTAKPAGSLARLNGAALENPSFSPDVAGAYEVELTATDSTGRAATKRLSFEASACGATSPVVEAAVSSPANPNTGQAVSLTATVTDADNAAPCSAAQSHSLRWTLTRLPPGSQAALSSRDALAPWFRPDLPGDYGFEVLARDSAGLPSALQALTVRVATCGSAAPSASVGADPVTPGVGQAVRLAATVADSDNDAPCSANQGFGYAWGFESLPYGSRAALNHDDVATPSFVPDAAGDYRLRLVVTDATNRASAPVFTTVSVSNCGAAAPVLASFGASAAGPRGLGELGQPVLLEASASDADNDPPCSAGQRFAYLWSLEALPAGSKAELNHAAEKPSFVPDVPGDFVVRVVATDSTGRSSPPERITVAANACGAAAPTATASALPSAPVIAQPVSLSAAVDDADNRAPCASAQAFTFAWTLDSVPAGSRAELNASSAASPSFVPDFAGDYLARVVVTDSAGRASQPAIVKVTVSGCGAAVPVATPSAVPTNPGIGQAVLLAATAADADNLAPCSAGQGIGFAWSFESLPAGSRAALNTATGSAPSFVADVAGDYVLRLVATDSTGRASAPAKVKVTASGCGSAAPDASVTASPAAPGLGKPVALAATVTDADNLPGCSAAQLFRYEWTLDTLPAGSASRLNSATAERPSFAPDLPGTYVARLVVTDSTGRKSRPATAQVVAADCGGGAPIATLNASPAAPRLGEPVRLSATIGDADNAAPCSAGQTFTTAWSLEALPAGSRARLSDETAAAPWFSPDVAGDYVVSAIATDSSGRIGAPATVRVTATACGGAPPVAAATASPTEAAIGQPVLLGAGVSDADNAAPCSAGQTFRFAWSLESAPAGSGVTLNAGSAAPSFAPDLPGEYVARVVVTDSTGRTSTPSLVAVTASACGGNRPVATITTSPAAVGAGMTVRLVPTVSDADNGATCQSLSVPPPLQTFSYGWTLLSAPAGSRSAIATPAAREPAFTADRPGEYAVRLIVTDSTGRASAPVDFTVAVDACGANAPAVSVLAVPTTAAIGQPVSVTATLSDADNAAACQSVLGAVQGHTWRWRLLVAPAGSQASVRDADMPIAGLTPDLAGTYVLEATATDSTGRTARAAATVTATPCGGAAPSASPSLDTVASALRVGGVVALRANATDADTAGTCGLDQSLAYSWWLSEAPAGSRAAISRAGIANPSFVPDVPGSYAASVQVTDSTGRKSATATVSIAVETCGGNPPVALMKATVENGATTGPAADLGVVHVPACHRLQLDGTPSSDPDVACAPSQNPAGFLYSWRLRSAPAGTSAKMTGGAATPTLQPDVAANAANPYVVELDVSDGALTSTAPARVAVTADVFKLASLAPASACVGALPAQLTISGMGLLRVNGVLPLVTFDGIPATVAGISGCATVLPGVESCTALVVNVPAWLPAGTFEVRVTNAVATACSDALTFFVGPPPAVTSVSPGQACEGPITLTLNGFGFGPTTSVLVGGNIPDKVTYVSNTRLIAEFSALAPGSHGVTVSNGVGCSSTLPNAVSILRNPSVFFVDPEVVYNGVSLQGTIYVSGINGGNVTSVGIRPTGSGAALTALAHTYDPTRPNEVQAIIPAGRAAGGYDVVVEDARTCRGSLANAFNVTDRLTLALAGIDPPFGWTSSQTAVTVTATTPPPPGFSAFQNAPRVYLNPSTGGGLATALKAVAYMNPGQLTAVARALPVGKYDLVAVNPDGAVGLLKDAFTVTASAPPLIDSISPGSIPASSGQTVVMRGSGFNAAVSVRLTCRSGGTTATFSAGISSVSATQASTIVPGDSIGSGSVCVIRATNPDGSYGEYSALGVTTPAENIDAFTVSPSSLVTARRALAATHGRATRTARFLYAIGGDSGSAATAMDTIEAVTVDKFGDLGAWRVLPTKLPERRTLAAVQVLDKYVYLVGGNDGTAPTAKALRAKILDPDEAPRIDSMLLDLAATGLGSGVWYYRVSAVMGAASTSNPGGEGLPSDPQPVKIPAGLPSNIQVTFTWTPVPGAAQYRIYRSPTADLASGNERLIDVVAGTTTQYIDVGAATGAQVPRRIGDLGEWATLAPLNRSREGLGLGIGQDPANASRWYLYATLGRNRNATGTLAALATYEYLPITIGAGGAQAIGTWTEATTNPVSTGRWQAGAFTVEPTVTTRFPPNETWIYAGPGLNTGATGIFGNVDAAKVQAGGALTTWTPVRAAGNYAGYGFAAAANQLFVFGGVGAVPSTGNDSGQLCGTGMSCAVPDLKNWNATGISLAVPRYLMGSTVESARIFLIGGQSTSGPTASVESTIW